MVELVDRDSVFEGEEFSGRISPKVLRGARDIDRTRGNQSDELMLVDGQCCFILVVFFEAVVEPVREVAVDALNRFAVGTHAEGCSSTA